jgi:hypothetical protein
MTLEQLNTALSLIIPEYEDYVQAIVQKMLGMNRVKDIALVSGANPILFPTAYDTGVEWELVKSKAINPDGYDVGFTISNETVTGFVITVDEPCTFRYVAMSYEEWISD